MFVRERRNFYEQWRWDARVVELEMPLDMIENRLQFAIKYNCAIFFHAHSVLPRGFPGNGKPFTAGTFLKSYGWRPLVYEKLQGVFALVKKYERDLWFARFTDFFFAVDQQMRERGEIARKQAQREQARGGVRCGAIGGVSDEWWLRLLGGFLILRVN